MENLELKIEQLEKSIDTLKAIIIKLENDNRQLIASQSMLTKSINTKIEVLTDTINKSIGEPAIMKNVNSKKLTVSDEQLYVLKYVKNKSWSTLSNTYGVSVSTIKRAVQRHMITMMENE